MKKSLLAIVFAAASMPLVFAAQANQPAKTDTATPATPASSSKMTKSTKTTKAKKAKKSSKKGDTKPATTASPSTEKQ